MENDIWLRNPAVAEAMYHLSSVPCSSCRQASNGEEGSHRQSESSVSYYSFVKNADAAITAHCRASAWEGKPRGDYPPLQFGLAPPDRSVSWLPAPCGRRRRLLVLVAGARACPGRASACPRSG